MPKASAEWKKNKNYSKRSFVYGFLNSMRQKINDPLGKKRNSQN